MEAAPPTIPVPPPSAQLPEGDSLPPVRVAATSSLLPAQSSANVSVVWPRSAQLATAFLLGLAFALLGIQMWSMSRWSTRPLDLNREKQFRYRIELNQANREQLLQVPGIGDRTAEKIEAYRKENGPFRGKAELTNIRGIGPAKYEKMGDWLTVKQVESKTVVDSSRPISQSRRTPSSPPKEPASGTSPKKGDNLKEPIDINQASLEELQKLPGIGPKKAQGILDERAKSPFRSVDDLRRVSGIGPKTLERLRPFVTVGPTSGQLALDSAGKD